MYNRNLLLIVVIVIGLLSGISVVGAQDQTWPAEPSSFLDGLTAEDLRFYIMLAVIVLQTILLFRQNSKLAELIPQDFAKGFADTISEQAAKTQSKIDDQWANFLQMAITWVYRTPPPVPPAETPAAVPPPPIAPTGSATTSAVSSWMTLDAQPASEPLAPTGTDGGG